MRGGCPRSRPSETWRRPPSFRIAGLKIAREPHRYSGRTAIHADVTVHEPKPPDDPDSALAFSMEGYQGQPPPSLIARFWAPGWNSVQSLNHYQAEVGGPLRGGDPGQASDRAGGRIAAPYFDRVPPPFEPHANEWLCVPSPHLRFRGAERARTWRAERLPHPYVALNPEDLARSGSQKGCGARQVGDASHRLVVRALPSLPAAIAGLPVAAVAAVARRVREGRIRKLEAER